MIWIENSFGINMTKETEKILNSQTEIKVGLVNVRTMKPLLIKATQESFGMKITISVEDLDLATDLFSDLTSNLNL